MRRGRVAQIPASQQGLLLKKAEEFAMAMAADLAARRFNAATSAAVHCVVAASDCLTVRELGLRSRGQDHLETLALLRSLAIPRISELLRQVRDVLSAKHAAEYSHESIDEEQARTAVKQASRVLAWIRSRVSGR